VHRLEPVPMPWMISPSSSDLGLAVDESGVAEVTLTAFFKFGGNVDGRKIEKNAYRKAVITFQPAFFVCFIGSENAGVLNETEYDISRISPREGETVQQLQQQQMESWRVSLVCPCSGLYAVADSRRLAEGQRLAGLGLNHWIVVGHDALVEALAKSMEWRLS
jgi:hypothetical protein